MQQPAFLALSLPAGFQAGRSCLPASGPGKPTVWTRGSSEFSASAAEMMFPSWLAPQNDSWL